MSIKQEVKRSENKYVINYQTYLELKSKLSKVMDSDIHNEEDGYIVRSLYFDSVDNVDFFAKEAGIFKRRKIRMRIYSTTQENCKLEMKRKIGDLSRKVSITISKTDANKLINGDYFVLTKYFDREKDAMIFYYVMSKDAYMPVCMVEYDRVAYTLPICNTRITFDVKIRSNEMNFNLFDKNIDYTYVFKDNIVLEVKYDGLLNPIIKDILKPYNLSRTSVSKYSMGRKVYYDFDF